MVLAAWRNAQVDPSERSMVLADAATGIDVEPVAVDRATGRRVDGDDFVFAAGPAASAPFVERYANRPRPNRHLFRTGSAVVEDIQDVLVAQKVCG